MTDLKHSSAVNCFVAEEKEFAAAKSVGAGA